MAQNPIAKAMGTTPINTEDVIQNCTDYLSKQAPGGSTTIWLVVGLIVLCLCLLSSSASAGFWYWNRDVEDDKVKK